MKSPYELRLLARSFVTAAARPAPMDATPGRKREHDVDLDQNRAMGRVLFLAVRMRDLMTCLITTFSYVEIGSAGGQPYVCVGSGDGG